MGRPLRIEYPDAFYHVTSRGNERKDVFSNDHDREKFLSYLDSAFERYGAVIHCYCLMSNHVHLLLETPRGNLSQVMRHIIGSYTIYFNLKHRRAGHLFQGRFKAILVDADEYAEELSRYIHLNPVRAGMVASPEEYSWSSYRGYIGMDRSPSWLELGLIMGYFGQNKALSRKRYRDFVESLLGKEYESPLKGVVASTILGGEGFVNGIAEKYLSGKKVDRNLPALRELSKISVKEVAEMAGKEFRSDEKLARKAAMHICHRYSGRTLREIGGFFEVGESAVTQTSRRFVNLLEKDRSVRKKTDKILQRFNLSNV